jgi:hypothetical protein
LHPDRNQEWRDEQDIKLGPTKAAQECDTDFLSSGRGVIDPKILEWYKENQIKDPVEKTGIDRNLWIWEYPLVNNEYIVVADVARGDSTDYSATQVFDINDLKQVAEYKGRLSTTDYGHFLIELSTKYNDALLVVENNNVGWATIQIIIDRGYKNLFYQSKDLKYVDTDNLFNSNRFRAIDRNMIPGFTTSVKTKPLIVAKMEEYTREKLVKLNSARLIEELFVFIYNSTKTEAMKGYNDDLVMAYSIALWIRDTALRINTERNSSQKEMLNSMMNINERKEYEPIYFGGVGQPKENPYEMDIGGEKEDLTWLLK